VAGQACVSDKHFLARRESMGQAGMARISLSRSLNAPAHAVFVPVGIVTVLLGPLLPILSVRWSLNYLQAGSLFTAQFLGSTAGVFISGFFVSRRGFRFAINAGLLMMAIGVGTLSFGTRSLGLISILSYGVGLGLAIPAVNLFVAAANPERRSAALSLLNFSWSTGAVACPFIVAAAAQVDRIGLFLLLLASSLFLMFLAVALMPLSFVEPNSATRGDRAAPAPVPRKWRALFALGALFFLYVGAENAFGGWIASYARSLGTPSSILPVMTPSFFYAALMIGRWMAPLGLKRVSETGMARAGLLIACLGMAEMVWSRTMPLVVISVSLAGLGFAAVYPITISRLSQEFGPAAARVGSIMFTMANFGGASLPWVVGYFSHRLGDLRAGLAVPLVSGMAMFFLYLREPRTGKVEGLAL
jgi:MFS transporter, FHS family, glucose/mannose:H+ symporter